MQKDKAVRNAIPLRELPSYSRVYLIRISTSQQSVPQKIDKAGKSINRVIKGYNLNSFPKDSFSFQL